MPNRKTDPEWYDEQVEKHGEGYVEKLSKQDRSEKGDRLLHEKYKIIFGGEIPDRFEDFEALKYDNLEKWV